MSLYTQAIENVKAAHLKAIQSFMEKNFPELMPDPQAMKDDLEQYFQGAMLEEEALQKYGLEQVQGQYARKAKGIINART